MHTRGIVPALFVFGTAFSPDSWPWIAPLGTRLKLREDWSLRSCSYHDLTAPRVAVSLSCGLVGRIAAWLTAIKYKVVQSSSSSDAQTVQISNDKKRTATDSQQCMKLGGSICPLSVRHRQ
jgi:hypothetical protein